MFRSFRPFALVGLLVLAACGSVKPEAKYPDPTRDSLYKYGSVLGEEGFNLFGPDRNKGEDASGIGVNGFLWRASLDTVSFMPIASADPFGGVILTDWYSPPETPGERYKVNLYILDRQLRADAIRATVFRQQKNTSGEWQDVATATETNTALEDTILTRARQIRVAQAEANQ